MKNFEDRKCKWGYITICNRCVKFIKGNPNLISFKSIKLGIEVKGMPLMDECEICGKKEIENGSL